MRARPHPFHGSLECTHTLSTRFSQGPFWGVRKRTYIERMPRKDGNKVIHPQTVGAPLGAGEWAAEAAPNMEEPGALEHRVLKVSRAFTGRT